MTRACSQAPLQGECYLGIVALGLGIPDILRALSHVAKGCVLDSTAEVLRLPLHGSRREAEFDPLGLGWQASCHAPDMPILGTSVFGGVTFQKAVPLSYWDASH